MPRRVVRANPLALPPSRGLRRAQARLGQAGRRHDHGVRPAAQGPHEGQGHRRSGSCRSSPTRPAPSASTRCSRRAKIYSPFGQTYEAVDRELLLSYKESAQGQILHEGITEAGSMASVIAAGSSYATHGEPMIPVYVFYSMFGFQRTGDQMWAMADQLVARLPARRDRRPHHAQRRGPAAPGRPQPAARLRPTRPASPTTRPSATRSRYIVEDGLRRMYGDAPEDVFYYLTVYNEPYPQPADAGPAAAARGRPARACTATPRPRARARGRRCWPAASPCGWRWTRSGCCARTGAWPPTSGASRAGTSCAARPSRASSTTCSTRTSRRTPYVTQALDGRGRSRRRGQRLDARGAGPDQPLGARATGPRWAPTASAARTPARRCAGTSTSTPSRSRWRCWPSWPAAARSAPRSPAKAVAQYDLLAEHLPADKDTTEGGSE